MNSRVKWRLLGLAAGIALMGLAILFVTIKSQQQSRELRARLNEVDSETFRIAERFSNFLRLLNGSMYRFGKDENPADLAEFQRASHELDLWIDQQSPRLTSKEERGLMRRIDAAYDQYLASAKDLQKRLDAAGHSPATMADYGPLMQVSQTLFDLGQDLARAHYQSRSVLRAQASRTIDHLRTLVLISLAALFVFGVALSVEVYRDMIAPLRVQLLESQALMERQEKLASLGLLAAGVAHEIRNPLTAIKAALFIQEKKFSPGSPELADARIVEREILRLERIVNDFLQFARPSDPHLDTIEAAAPVREVQSLLAPQLARNNIKLLIEPAPSARIKADTAQIKQVLINLVQNAADAIGYDGIVRMRVREDRKRLDDRETPVVVLEVEDNGRGIPKEVQARLFDPFFTTKDGGTGLGLSIAAGIVQRHGGMLQYQTQVDYGTTFGIILPEVPAGSG
jgi:signal transduction histidine kinase